MKFIFKTDKPTGKWKAFQKDVHNIKLNGCEIGTIDDESPHKVRLMVIKKDINEDGTPNCDWKWITLRAKFTSVSEAKEWLNASIVTLLDKYQFNFQKYYLCQK